MKDHNSLIGGNLLCQYIPNLATYYRKAVQAYAAQGIGIHAMTLQNEPLYNPPDYPGMLVTADQERQLAKALRTELTNNGLSTGSGRSTTTSPTGSATPRASSAAGPATTTRTRRSTASRSTTTAGIRPRWVRSRRRTRRRTS
jgi:hypothetical protein